MTSTQPLPPIHRDPRVFLDEIEDCLTRARKNLKDLDETAVADHAGEAVEHVTQLLDAATNALSAVEHVRNEAYRREGEDNRGVGT